MRLLDIAASPPVWGRLMLLAGVVFAMLLLLATGEASAYSAPSSLGSDPTLCPPRPPDFSAAAAGGLSQDETETAQELQDACELQVRDEGQLHTDLGNLDSDVTGGDSKLDADLSKLDSDVQQLDADVKAQGSASGAGSTVTVSNFPADQTVALDASSLSAQDEDAHGVYSCLWVVVGAVVGCFALGQVLDRLWP